MWTPRRSRPQCARALGARPWRCWLLLVGLGLAGWGALAQTTSVVATNAVSTTITVSSTPRGAGVNAARHKAYVANGGSNSVSVINTPTNTVAETITVGAGPLGLDVNATTDRIYVANNGSATVSVLSDTVTAVRLVAFQARAVADGVWLTWQTGAEVGNLGFHLYRVQAGQRVRVTPELVAGAALLTGPHTVLATGQTYDWMDRLPQAPGPVQYWLEDVDLQGQHTWHGPVAVTSPTAHDVAPPAGVGQAALLSSLGRAAMRQEGWYHVSQPDLVAAGLDPRADPRRLQLYVEGQEVPMHVTGQEDGTFDASDAIEFYGLGLDAAWTDARVYWLVVGARSGRRIALVAAQGDPDSAHRAYSPAVPWGQQYSSRSFPYTVERRERTIYFASLRNGDRENFFGAVLSQTPARASLRVRHLDATPPGTTWLEVALQGVSAGAHEVRGVVTLSVPGRGPPDLGHGSVNLWGGGLLNADDARGLSNRDRLSVVVAMTCLNGYVHDPTMESLAEILLHAEDGGAAAVWASSGMVEAGGQVVMNQALYRWLFTERTPQGTPLTLGEATVRAKAAVSNRDTRRTWMLLGDPTMLLNIR